MLRNLSPETRIALQAYRSVKKHGELLKQAQDMLNAWVQKIPENELEEYIRLTSEKEE